ncbi:MAG: YbhB/YbcL family Raf kinase inhibitor-like protein [Anaerolineae bacterium]|nr:YbhB/YbcL family Raf kinase inhibitor-like protein [Anaerolineae bacterium]
MTREPGTHTRTFTIPWLIGTLLFLAAFFVLFLMLGWFYTFELLTVAVGLAALSGILVLFALANPAQHWPLWAAYLLFGLGFVLGIGFLLDYDFAVVLASGVALLGLPFLWLYLDRVWIKGTGGYWWAGLIAGALVTLGVSLLHYRAGWPPHLLRGLIIFTFMGGVSASAFMVWAPNWREAHGRWLVLLTIVAGLFAIVGMLDAVDMEFLIPVVFLMIGGSFFLIRGVLAQAQYERERQQARLEAAAGGPALPPGPPPDDARDPLLMRGVRSSPSLPIQGHVALPAVTAPAQEPAEEPATSTEDTQVTQLSDTQPAPPRPVSQPVTLPGAEASPPATIRLSSPAFLDGDSIPPAYTDARAGKLPLSPPLKWEHLPSGTRALVLVVDTPDPPEGIRTHWTVYNLPPQVSSLPADIAPGSAPGGGQQMVNDFGVQGYSPPVGERIPGQPYRYFFKLYALDVALPPPPDGPRTRRELNAAMRGHILAIGQLVGVYPVRPGSLPG